MTDKQKYIPPILAALIVAIFPNVGRLPAWIVLWCTFMWGYMFFSLKFSWPWPGRAVRLSLSAIGILGLLATFNVRLGPAAYLGLLAVMAALKPFEIFTHRDRMVTIFLAYFIVIASLFQSNSLFITVYMFLSVFVTTAALVRINDPYGNFRENLRLSGRVMAQAVPLMIVLFLLFPRIQGSLFGLSHATVAESGFSDRLTFASVSRLVVNTDVAFRAEFDGAVPPPRYLYWRGIVFDYFDGKVWHRSRDTESLFRPPKGKNPVHYTVILDPSGNRFLFALDLPGKIPRWAQMDSEYTLRMHRPVNQTMAYAMTSYLDYREGYVNRWSLQKDTRLPGSGNPRSRALARQLTKGAYTVSEKVRRVLAYFKDNGFDYTLNPPVLGKNPIDDFLFESKKGYCQHYAVAFAFLMRAAGVPTRLVAGYLGGETNPFGSYMIIRQSDAHVWDEVWEPGNGWVRVDPTETVAPNVINGGTEGSLGLDGMTGGRFLKYLGPFSKYIQDIGYGWDAVTTAWSAWFYAYSYDQQKALLEKIGIRWGAFVDSLLAVLLILVLISGFIAGYVLLGFKKPGRRFDAVGKHYEKFCSKLSRIGIERSPDQGAIHFAQYIAEIRPDLKQAVDEITQFYVQLRYRPETESNTLKRFIMMVKTFNPSRKTTPIHARRKSHGVSGRSAGKQ